MGDVPERCAVVAFVPINPAPDTWLEAVKRREFLGTPPQVPPNRL